MQGIFHKIIVAVEKQDEIFGTVLYGMVAGCIYSPVFFKSVETDKRILAGVFLDDRTGRIGRSFVDYPVFNIRIMLIDYAFNAASDAVLLVIDGRL
jgi:hypothetical protein